MDGFVRHLIESVPVDIEVVSVAERRFAARFRVVSAARLASEGHVVHAVPDTFDTPEQAEEAAKSAALAQILAQGSGQH